MDFERVFDRRKDGSVKWNRYNEDVIPLWVADMDFEVAEPIQKAIRKFISTGIYGYAGPPEELAQVLIRRFKELYDWDVQREWIVWTPSIVSSLYISAKAASKDPYGVMTSVPVYHPFLTAAQGDGRWLQEVSLKETDGRWQMDFEAMEKVADESTKLYILCNPHNPTGRMYSREELKSLADFCLRKNILICSDEIHADIVLDSKVRHTPIASLSAEIANRTISLFSAGKAFNTPGLNAAVAVIPDASVRGRFEHEKDQLVPYMTKLAGEAALAAYAESGEWLKEAIAYLKGNHDYLFAAINDIPGLKMNKVEGTYLAWIDYTELGIEKFSDFLLENGVGVIEGTVFHGKNHIRLNFATQRNLLEEAVNRIRKTVSGIAK